MTDKEFLEYYTQYEEVFESAINLSYLHLTYSEFEKIIIHYEDVFGKKLRKAQLNCNSCRLKILKDFGYKLREIKAKPKKGRPTKINLDENVE